MHAAAIADPDRCERDPELARRVNADGTRLLAEACARRGLRLVALSTDLVFPGTGAFRHESDPTGPISVYGRTKLDGERAVLEAGGNAAVARIALVTGHGHGVRGTATEAVAWTLRAGRRVRLFTDQWRTPVDADSVADGVIALLERHATGVFHLGGPERVSRHELGLRVALLLGLSTDLIEPVRYARGPAEAERPSDVSLDSTRARSELAWQPRSLEAAILLGRDAPDIIQPPVQRRP